MENFEMASEGDTEGIVLATQRSFVTMLKRVIADVRKGESSKLPGLTWDQIDYLLDETAKKSPTIIKQERDF